MLVRVGGVKRLSGLLADFHRGPDVFGLGSGGLDSLTPCIGVQVKLSVPLLLLGRVDLAELDGAGLAAEAPLNGDWMSPSLMQRHAALTTNAPAFDTVT